MIDSWIDCPHCGRSVSAIFDTCTSCGGDLKTLPDGRPNPHQRNPHVDAFQVGAEVDKAALNLISIVIVVLMLIFVLGVVVVLLRSLL